ncbi:MAG: PIN domain-containing protein [Deltaproteobacteria bacterium]|nr:PIN domain-containing protein [Deltaproteobacteria bacterium]
MKALVDTTVWSLALRRRPSHLSAVQRAVVRELADLIGDDLAVLVGSVRQEVLSGVRDQGAFRRLRQHLRAFADETLTAEDYEVAAEASNRCRAAGVASSSVDMLICAVALRRGFEVFTTDADFDRYAAVLGARLHALPAGGAAE